MSGPSSEHPFPEGTGIVFLGASAAIVPFPLGVTLLSALNTVSLFLPPRLEAGRKCEEPGMQSLLTDSCQGASPRRGVPGYGASSKSDELEHLLSLEAPWGCGTDCAYNTSVLTGSQ